MSSVVTLKKKGGQVLSVIMDQTADFDEVCRNLRNQLREGSALFNGSQQGIEFVGRNLSVDEQNILLDIIEKDGGISVICLLENDDEKQQAFLEALSMKNYFCAGNVAQMFVGNVRSGQTRVSETSIVIIGDVNPGAEVIADGNIIVIGALRGTAYAGRAGGKNSFIIALNMKPVQIQIADLIARGPDDDKNGKNDDDNEPKMAYIDIDGSICMEPITRSLLNTIKF